MLYKIDLQLTSKACHSVPFRRQYPVYWAASTRTDVFPLGTKKGVIWRPHTGIYASREWLQQLQLDEASVLQIK